MILSLTSAHFSPRSTCGANAAFPLPAGNPMRVPLTGGLAYSNAGVRPLRCQGDADRSAQAGHNFAPQAPEARQTFVAKNISRRHLSTSQRAMIAAKLAILPQYANRRYTEAGIPASVSPNT